MKRFVLFLLAILISISSIQAEAAPKWSEIGARIDQTIQQSLEIFDSGDRRGAKEKVNDAYYGIYEKDGLESAVNMGISAKTANLTEYQFYKLKKFMLDETATSEQVHEQAETLVSMIYESTTALETANLGRGGWASFLPAFLILLREGLEAILVLVAIIAYLQRSGNEKHLDTVYNAMIAAIIASFVTAYLFESVLEATAAGASREVLEGATALFAVVVLIATSAWLGGKSNANAWKDYIQGMVDKTLTTGKAKALALAAFLAVYREGAEVILFYQALFNNASNDVEMIWFGFAAGCVAIALIFFVMQRGILRIPLRPFFMFTSILMYLLAVSFAGGGIRELQEGGILATTQIENSIIPTIDVLGIYPTFETLGIQFALLILGIATFVYYQSRQSKGSHTEAAA